MKPYINLMSNFDANNDYILTYTYLGSERILTNQVSIREAKPNARPIYTRESTKFDKNHTVPANTLINGNTYLVKIRVKVNGKWSEWSAETKFLCLAEPVILFQSLDEKSYVYNNDVMMTAIYRQEQGERVKTYQFTLMDENKVPIVKYPVRYPDQSSPNVLKERVSSLSKGKMYHIACRVITQNGVNHLEVHEFVPHYVAPSLDGMIQTKSQDDSGQILVQAYLKQLLGTQTKPYIPNAPNDDPINYAFLNNEWVVIPPTMPLSYVRLGMAKASDWVGKIWCKNVLNGVMLDFSREFGEGVHIKFIKYDDYIVIEKEYNGVVYRTKSNTIKSLKLNPFYMYIKVVEFRISVKIEAMDKYDILFNFGGSVSGNSRSGIMFATSREEVSPDKMTKGSKILLDNVRYKGDNREVKVIGEKQNDRSQLAVKFDILEILENQLSDSIWRGKTDIESKIKFARNIVENINITLTARGSSTIDNDLSVRGWTGSEWELVTTSKSAKLTDIGFSIDGSSKFINDDGYLTVGMMTDYMYKDGVSEISLDYIQLGITTNMRKA